jgi:cysteine-rich secretory family protein
MRVGRRRVVAVPFLSACLGALLVLVPATTTRASAAEAGPAASSADLHDDLPGAQQLAAQINAERAARGLPALAIHGELTSIAQAHSRRMAAAGTIWHNDELFSRASRTRLGAEALGENVGADGRDGKIESHQMYMASGPHRANILDPRFTAMGIGVTIVDGVAYSAEDFMQSAPPPPVPRPQPAPAPRAMAAAAAPAAPASPAVTSAPAPARPPEVVTADRAVAVAPPRPTATPPLPAARLATTAGPVLVEPASPAIPDGLAAALGLADGLLALTAIAVRRRVVGLARPFPEVAAG